MRKSVAIKVPATSANMGPGFDCLGMALDIWNFVEVEEGPLGVDISGEGADALPKGKPNLVYQSFCVPFKEAGESVPEVRVVCRNEIPLGRGLGSSSAAVVAGLLAGNSLCGRPLSQQHLLELAAKLEGHPDNVAPALLGGCQIVLWEDERLIATPVPIPDNLRVVVLIPDLHIPTEKSRNLLPGQVSRQDAVYNVGRVALLVRAFLTGSLTDLGVATRDRLHQPARQSVLPAMESIFRAALGAGAFGVFLSGAGSSVVALTAGRELTVGYEMADAAAKFGLNGTLKVTSPTNVGAQVDVK